MAILFTFGINDSGEAGVRPDDNGQINIHTDGNCNVLGKIDLGQEQVMPLLLYGLNAKQPDVPLPFKPTLVFNQISDADTHKAALGRCKTLCDQLGVPVLNPPEAVLRSTRDGVAELLKDIPGVQVPRTVAVKPRSPADVFSLIESHGLQLPVMLRIAGDHNAMSLVLIMGPEDLDKLHRFAFDGRAFYLTEWVDYADSSGIYFKQRLVMVGGQAVVRHSFFNEDWILNSGSLPYMLAHPEVGTPEALVVEIENQRLPLAEAAVAEIDRRMGLDYYGIDCSIDKDGQLLIFEVNANMDSMVYGIEELNHRTDRVKRLVEEMVKERARAVSH
jgi:hypothetical protein